jgi:3-hydroxyacyl-CoA dehydrogenase
LTARLGKIAVRSGNAEGFIGNRIYSAYRSEAESLALRGALPAQVDTAMREFGFAMGPFAVADASGLDIAWRMRQRKRAEGTLSPEPTLADELCERGRFGVKTGAGWYRYEEGSRKPLRDPEVAALIATSGERRGVATRTFTSEEIQTALLAAILAEANTVLREGVAESGTDVDLVWLHGYGFPRDKGGPVHWARNQDPDRLRAALQRKGVDNIDALLRTGDRG